MKKRSSREKNKSGYDDLQDSVRQMKLPRIEVWENKYPDREYWVEMDVPEFTCICPKTGLPDFAGLTIRYRPDQCCIELKSFKYYITAFRSLGIFHEHVVNRVLDDFVKACRPRQASVRGVFNPRGGITTTVSAEYTRP